jgi:hypothetical protein
MRLGIDEFQNVRIEVPKNMGQTIYDFDECIRESGEEKIVIKIFNVYWIEFMNWELVYRSLTYWHW